MGFLVYFQIRSWLGGRPRGRDLAVGRLARCGQAPGPLPRRKKKETAACRPRHSCVQRYFLSFFPSNRVLCCNKDTVRFAAKFSSEAALSGRIRAARFGAVAADGKGRPRTARKKSCAPKKRRSLPPKESRTVKKKESRILADAHIPNSFISCPTRSNKKHGRTALSHSPVEKLEKKIKLEKKEMPQGRNNGSFFLGLFSIVVRKYAVRRAGSSCARATIGRWDKKMGKKYCVRDGGECPSFTSEWKKKSTKKKADDERRHGTGVQDGA